MAPTGDASVNRRQHERFRLPAMYTSVSAQPVEGDGPRGLAGHAYDISESGIRIELDEALQLGQVVDLRLDLPGNVNEVSARADVVWVNTLEDDPGPRRMALRFTEFKSSADHTRLVQYLSSGLTQAAAA